MRYPEIRNRITPALPASAMKTYQIVAPLETHYRKATCAEFECDSYLHGWQTVVPADSPAATYIRHDKSRSHREERQAAGLSCFTFPPGQQAFATSDGAHDHYLPLNRPEVFYVKGGDFRGNPRGTPPRRLGADDWVDSFANHQIKLAERLERG